MTAAAFSAAQHSCDAPGSHASKKPPSAVPLPGAAADFSAMDADASARDKSRSDAKHGKKAKASHARDDVRVDVEMPDTSRDDSRDSKLTPLERCEKRLRAAKRATRSELSVSGGDWSKNGYASNPDVLSTANLGDDLPRISAKEVSVREFRERFEIPRLPCIITDAMDHWNAVKGDSTGWTYDNFLKRFGDRKFKVGSDDDGYAVRLKFAHVHHYLTGTSGAATAAEDGKASRLADTDDSPLYVFDGGFGDENGGSKPLLDDYDVPSYFREDLFGIAGEKRRPPYRWVVLGPPRSGSSVHVDPLATSAWNALVSGRKRWCFFPPAPAPGETFPFVSSAFTGLRKPDLKPKGLGLDGESVTWFQKMYPRTRSLEWRSVGNRPPPLDAVQNAGEIVYVPDGWWHAVLNLEHTVAVTQNVVGSSRFDKVWRVTRRSRPKFSAQWLRKLKAKRFDLARLAEAQPRRGEGSADERSSSDSSSSSSEESSDSEDLYEYEPDAVRDERPAVCDAVLREMAAARERRRDAENRSAARRPGAAFPKTSARRVESRNSRESKKRIRETKTPNPA
jgi:histone arginine demethylase JMJD6